MNAFGCDNGTIMVVDDLPLMRTTLQTYLNVRQYAVWTAHDGAEALTQAARVRPDLVLIDSGMPHMTGYDICRQFRGATDTADIPVILYSLKPEGEAMRRLAAESGAVGVLDDLNDWSVFLEQVGAYMPPPDDRLVPPSAVLTGEAERPPRSRTGTEEELPQSSPWTEHDWGLVEDIEAVVEFMSCVGTRYVTYVTDETPDRSLKTGGNGNLHGLPRP